MRLIRIDPFTRKLTREFVEDGETGVMNFLVQSSELMVINLGQEHLLWLDANWAVREKNAFFSLTMQPNAVLGGYAVVSGIDLEHAAINPEEPVIPNNCGLPVDATSTQFQWVEPEAAALHSVVQGLRAEHSGWLPREVILRGRTGPESVH